MGFHVLERASDAPCGFDRAWNGEIQAVDTVLRVRLSLVRAAGALDVFDGMVLHCVGRAVSGTDCRFSGVLLQCCDCPAASAGEQKRMALQNGITNKSNCVIPAGVTYGTRYKEAQEMTAWGLVVFAVFIHQ